MVGADILDLMKKQVALLKPDENWGDVSHVSVAEVLKTSFDVMEFVMNLEEELGLKEDIDLEVLAPKFAQNITFEELAVEVEKYLVAEI
jgi:acyl carrier protein